MNFGYLSSVIFIEAICSTDAVFCFFAFSRELAYALSFFFRGGVKINTCQCVFSLVNVSMFCVFFHLQSDESLVLYHFQCHGWKENGVTRAESLVYLQQQVHKVEPGEHKGPIIVHCRYRSNIEPSPVVTDSHRSVSPRSLRWAAN